MKTIEPELTLEEIAIELNDGNPVVKEQKFTCGCIYAYHFRPSNRFDLWSIANMFNCGCNGKIKNVLEYEAAKFGLTVKEFNDQIALVKSVIDEIISENG